MTESVLIEERGIAELREQFVAVPGHDLRTPVRGIRCLADLLLQTPLTERAVTMVRLM